MAARDWDDPEEEALAVQAQQARLRRIDSYRTSANRQQAQTISALKAAYPHLSPGTAVPLGLSGATPDSPIAQTVAVKEAKKNKKKRGGFMGLVDRVTRAPGNVVGAIGDVADEIGDVGSNILKPVVRYGTAALAAPFEEAIGAGRALAANLGEIGAGAISGAAVGGGVGGIFGGIGAIPGAIGGAVVGGVAGALADPHMDVEGSGWRPQSMLGTALTGGPGLGKGYLPGKAVMEAAGGRARKTGRIGNHAWTPGRFFAATVFDEDTTPYNLMSGVMDMTTAMKLDPYARGAARLGKARKAVKEFQAPSVGSAFLKGTSADQRLAAGLVDGAHRPGLVRENVRSWLDSADGVRAKEYLAGETDFEALRRRLGRDVDSETILDIVDARTADEIDLILNPKLGIATGLEAKPNIPGVIGSQMVKVRRRADDVRMFANMPRGGINLSQPEEAIEQFTRLQQTAKIPLERVSRNNEALARALRDKDIARAEAIVLKDFVGGPDGIMRQAGVSGPMAQKMTNTWERLSAELRADVLSDVATGGAGIPAVRLAGETQQIAAPALMAEALENLLDFDQDTIRNIRRLTSRFPTIMSDPRYTAVVGGAEAITARVWKLTTLVRGAYTTRNVAEAQGRMAAVGHDTVFSSPLDYFALVVGDNDRIAGILKKFGMKTGRAQADTLGRLFDENPVELERALRGEMNTFAAALNRDARAEGWLDGAFMRGASQNTFKRDSEHFSTALAERLEMLHQDPVARAMANPGRSAVRTSPEFPWAPEMVFNDPELGPALQEFASLVGAKQLSKRGGRIPDVDPMRAQLTRTMKQAQKAAGNDATLWDVIATGQLDGVPMRLPDGKVNKAFNEKLRGLVAAGAGPDQIVGQSVAMPGFADKWNRGVRRVFDVIEGTPTAKLVSSPTYRQFHYDEIKKLVVEANPEAQRALIEGAGEAGMKREFLDDLRRRAKVSSGDLNHDEVELLAGNRAMRSTQKLLYQAVDKNQLADILRIVFPFASAQMNSLRTWARLGLENPAVPRRAAQIISGARGADPFGTGHGIFYKDPQTGEEMFTYPGSEALTGALFGMPIPLGGRVEGLNMFGSGLMPGAGPMVQVTARWLLPDKPQYDSLREIIDPYGESAEGGLFDQFTQSFVPAWARNIATGKAADESDRRFGDAVFAVFTAGVSSGEFDNTTPEGIAEGMEAAKAKARGLFLLQGLATFGGAPTNPSAEFLAMDKTGQWQMIGMLKEEYRALQEEDPETANERFLEKFGTDVGLVMQPTTQTGGKVLSEATSAAGDWVRRNEGIVKDYDAIYGVFTPTAETDDFDSQTWARQMRSGERWPLDPEQRIKLANDRLAKMIFYNAKDRFGPYPSGQQKQVLRLLRESLQDEYPGFEENLGLPEKVKIEDKIAQLEQAAEDERLADHAATPALRTYLAARTKLNEMAQQAGRANVNKAKDMAPLRAILRQLGEALASENRAFTTAWERILSSEIAIDDVDTEAGALV